MIEEGEPTIPVTIGDEKLANPFLRADVPDLAVDVGMAGKPAAEVFAEIRGRKNKILSRSHAMTAPPPPPRSSPSSI